MKHVVSVTVLTIVMGCAAVWGGAAIAPPAMAADSAPVTPSAQTQNTSDRSKVVCTRESVMGSNIKKKVCRTQVQIDDQREASQKVLDDLNSSQTRSGGAGG